MATPIQRALAAMEAIKGTPVAAPIANKWIESFYDAYGPIQSEPDENGQTTPLAYADLTNDQKGLFLINHLRDHFRGVRKGVESRKAATAAQDNKRAAVEAEATADFGARE